jgi:membrane protein
MKAKAPAKKGLIAVAQRLVFAFERSGEHELGNHAAAGAYAFLLSAMPAVLLALGLASSFLRARPGALAEARLTVAAFLGPMAAADIVDAFFSQPLGSLAAAIGILSLLYSSRLLVVSIQRAMHVIWAQEGRAGILRTNILGFLLQLLILIAIVAILAASEATRFLSDAFGSIAGSFLDGALVSRAMRGAYRAAPPLVLLAFVYVNYRLTPSGKRAKPTAFAYALLCVLATIAVSGLFGVFMSGARYNLLYGIFGNLIVLLANVYAFFSLFYFFAELIYVEDHLDALLFARFQKYGRRAKEKGLKLEKALFGEPDRLVRRYGRVFAPDERLFSIGDGGKDAYFVQGGSVGIYLPSAEGELRLGTIRAGEIFGEMALVQGEARSATARADSESLILVIPQAVFELYLQYDEGAQRRLAEMLSDRLRLANERLAVLSPSKGEGKSR